MSFRFHVDSRYRDCRSRFMFAQCVKNELTRPNGAYRWIVQARPNTVFHIFVLGDTFNIRVYDVPPGTILSPKGMHSPIKEFYRQTVTPQIEAHVRRSKSLYANERACLFFAIQGENDTRVVRELEFVEFHKQPEADGVCLDFTIPLEALSFDVNQFLK